MSEQQSAARVAGFLYLFTNATAIFGFYARTKVIAAGDAARTAANIVASEALFRAGIAAEMITIAGVIMLVAALYVVIEPVQRNWALLATFWRLAENFVLAVVPLNELAMLRLARHGDSALVSTLLGVYGDGFQIGFMFLGLGSAVFAYLWLKSRYVPRWLAVIGILASSLMAIVELAKIAVPGLAAVISMAYMAPMGVFEFTMGGWLLFRGIRTSTT